MTTALTTSTTTKGATSFGDELGSLLSDPAVIGSIGGLASSVIGSLTGAGKPTPEQLAAQAAAAKAAQDAQQTQLLVIGGVVAVIVVVGIVIALRRKS